MTSEEVSDWGPTSFNFINSNYRIRLFGINANKFSQNSRNAESDQNEDISGYRDRNRDYSRNCTSVISLSVPGCSKDSSVQENLICSACLDDNFDYMNEILLCAGCGVSVHEQCYGVDYLNSKSNSLSSNNTESCICESCENDSIDSTHGNFHPYYDDLSDISDATSLCNFDKWFCEACKAGVTDLNCELCPNKGGIFRETFNGKWVHLVCALYIPEVKFRINDRFISVNLFEIPFSRWGAEKCSLCADDKFSSTGICISCEDEICKTYFHVTCAQAAGLLLEMNSGDSALFINNHTARCEFHSCKMAIARRKANYNSAKKKLLPGQIRMQRKLTNFHLKHKVEKNLKISPWIPRQKILRLLTTSVKACRRLHRKTELFGIEFQEMDDMICKLNKLKCNFQRQFEIYKKRTLELQDVWRVYNLNTKLNINHKSINAVLNRKLYKLNKQLEALGTNKIKFLTEDIGSFSRTLSTSSPISGQFAAAFKMGVNSFQTLPHTTTKDLLKRCDICNYHETNVPSDRNELHNEDKFFSSKITPLTLRKRKWNADVLENKMSNRNEVKNTLVSNSSLLQTNKKPKIVLVKIKSGNTVVDTKNKQKRTIEQELSNEKLNRKGDENLFEWNKCNTIYNCRNSKYYLRNTRIRSSGDRDISSTEISSQLS